MAGPLPAEKTPLRWLGNPSHSLRTALNVANPMPAGRPSNQNRKRHARLFANVSTSPPETIRAWATIHACSVSSETMPFPNTNRCPLISGYTCRCLRFDIPSQDNPTLSPTAVPSKQPIIASSLVPAILIPAPKINAVAIAGMGIDIGGLQQGPGQQRARSSRVASIPASMRGKT